MDAEFISIIGGGILFILVAVALLVRQRRQAAPPAEPKPTKGKPEKKPEKKAEKKAAAEPKEKRSLLASLSAIGITKEEKSGPTAEKLEELEGLIKANHLDEAARLAMRLSLWDRAAQLYLKVGQYGNAAHCAKRADKFAMAAEFYEKAGDLQGAVRMWEKAGDHQKARELAGDREKGGPEEDAATIVIGKELQQEIDAAVEKKDHVRAAELYEQAGDREHAAEQLASFAQTARRPEVYAEKLQALSPRVAYNVLRIAKKGRRPGPESAELYRRLAMLQHHFGNRAAAADTLEKLLRVVPDDFEAQQMLEEIDSEPTSTPSLDGPSSDAPPTSEKHPVMVRGPESSRPDFGDSVTDEDDAADAGESGPDEAVEAARSGPSIAELVKMIGSSPCDLSNIEVFYRLGLACLAANKVTDARRAFEAVEDVSPGYRDTSARLRSMGG